MQQQIINVGDVYIYFYAYFDPIEDEWVPQEVTIYKIDEEERVYFKIIGEDGYISEQILEKFMLRSKTNFQFVKNFFDESINHEN